MAVYRIQVRRDTTLVWATVNPTLASGEIGFETDSGKIKIGDGATDWNTLAYFSAASLATLAVSGGGTGQVTAQAAIDTLTDVASTTNEYILTKDTATGHAKFKASPAGAWTEVGALDYLTTTTNKVAIGRTSLISTEKVVIDGSTDIIQMIIRGNATQTANTFEVRKSDNTVNFAVTNTAGVTVGGTTSQISDTNGNELLKFTATASAVNEVTIASGATGVNWGMTASGETNTGITLTGKGTKGVTIGNALLEKVVTITDGAGAVINASLGNVFTWTGAADRTAGTTTNPTAGQKMILVFIASGGARTLTLPTAATGDFAYGSDITVLSQTASGKADVIGCVYGTVVANRWAVIGYSKGF